jgi:eukaryotic-like serine/threonine-protein kinase
VDDKINNLEVNSLLGHYRIISKIGAGGMGEVYLAKDTRLDRKVALKILPPEFAEDKDRMNRFVREAKSASALNHPNIITIHEIGESGGTHFIATEFIDGKTLNEYVKGNSLDFKSVLEIAIQIASALDEAHAAGIVHRDIKPDNVMIRANGLVKILDFGIAKLTGTKNQSNLSEEATTIKGTSPGMIIGTANYMSPEQAKGKEVDARSDIFSFGVVLYEMISGRLPFEGETPVEIIGAILHKEPLPLERDVPSEIKKIIGECLRKDRDERYQTIRDVLIDLKDVRQELEFQNKLERTASPEIEEPKTRILQATTVDEAPQSSTNITINSKPKKLYLAGALAILLISAAVFFAYRYLAPSSKQIESIAVLPFVNEGGNADAEYLSDGMTETLISSLSQLPNLNVKARSSVFRYKGEETDAQTIGKELNVQAVLNGRVVQRSDDLVLYLELVDARTGNRIWGDQYNKKLINLVSLQTEIARDVSQKLKTKLTGADEQKITRNYTENTEAYQLYLRGRYHAGRRTPQEVLKAIEYHRKAIAVDPNYALAFVGLSDAYRTLSDYGGATPHEALPKAKEALTRALSLDNNLAEARVSLCGIFSIYDYDFAAAERECKRAIELNPNYMAAYHAYGMLLTRLGRHEESFAAFKRGLEIEPLALELNKNYGESLFFARRYEESISQFKKTLELDPNFAPAHISLGAVYFVLGRHAECIEEYAILEELFNRPKSAALVRETFARKDWQGFVRMMSEENELFSATPYSKAFYLAELGEKDRAFTALNSAYEKRIYRFGHVKVDPRLDPLRQDPRFEELLRKVGFPQ